MPYIKRENREKLMPFVFEMDSCLDAEKLTAGELNYIITKLILKMIGSKPSYKRYNEIIGALECCKLELYRRQISMYENKKILENGDVDG